MAIRTYGPVAWHDGMLIEAQHFQQAERSVIHYIDSRFSQLQSHYWGFSVIEINSDSLGLGKLGIRQAKGVMPDGTPFYIPEHDDLPAPLLTESAKIGDIACLAIKSARSDGIDMIFGDEDIHARYHVHHADVHDSVAGMEEDGSPKKISIPLGKLKFRLCWQKTARADEVTLPFARVLRKDQVHSVVLDSGFIPPLLDIRAHERLAGICEEMQSLLQVRLLSTAGVRFLSAGGDVADLIVLLLGQTMSEYSMRLAHLACYHPLPPATLFMELVGLLGRLSVLPNLSEEVNIQDLAYQHHRLGESFDPLIHAVRLALARIIETPIVALEFERRDDQAFVHVINPQLKLNKIIFAFRANMPAERLRTLLPQQSKFGPVEYLQKLVDLQLPGARLIALPSPPRQVPYYAHSVYFEVESTDPYWKQTVSSAAMALRIVGDFPDISFEAWGLRETNHSNHSSAQEIRGAVKNGK